MNTYYMQIKGNDIFTHTKLVKASCFKNAVTLAEELVESLGGGTIEQISIVEVSLENNQRKHNECIYNA